MTGEENLSYPSTEQVVNKINYTHAEKLFDIRHQFHTE